MKIRVTIDTKDNSFDSENEDSYTRGVYNMDLEGVYRAYYGSPNYFVNFEDVEIIECKHEDGYDKNGKCWDCESPKICDVCDGSQHEYGRFCPNE